MTLKSDLILAQLTENISYSLNAANRNTYKFFATVYFLLYPRH